MITYWLWGALNIGELGCLVKWIFILFKYVVGVKGEEGGEEVTLEGPWISAIF